MVYTCVDLFAGAGGLSEGLRQAGFTILAANDFDDHAATTYKHNHPETIFFDGPIQDIQAEDILKRTGLKRGELFCLAGGPPCQAFSVYNHQRGMHDERSGLFREYIRIVEGLYPKWIVMENVTGMSSVEGGLAIKEIIRSLTELGYEVECKTLKAEEYGVPQERRRIIFIGNRLGLPIRFPEPSHDGVNRPFVNVEQAIMDLPEIGVNGGADEMDYTQERVCEYQRYVRDGSLMVFNHTSPNLSDINIKRLSYIKQGGSWRDIPVDLLPAGMKKAKRSDHTKRYGRLSLQGLSSTILTKCDPHWGAYFHPTQDRVISVREAARFQSFPDKFRFLGPKAEQYKQVGNAVPPLLARAVAMEIINVMNEHEAASEEKLIEVH
ncbi:DNA methyltransferase [Gordoniibacillus kamchatkensis]|uniref:DNA (cytosine-5-)-methyltransferase n=1 Tax=Gordoniibacillus kamchatkensis TaxID=1590651 RepID=A0ABR5AF52_9BACL|nr:DNA cytosine methyltransferase [Paenibacillus sp. VKM B-2647]KIL39303.1 DNA methyltransferase [Paenibacillus sp. VKM B-2647]